VVDFLILFLVLLFGGGGFLIATIELSHNRIGPMLIFIGAALVYLIIVLC